MSIEIINISDIKITDKIRLFPQRGRWQPWQDAIDALRNDITDPRYQYIFKPITVVQFSHKSHIRSNIPPFIYYVSDGRKRLCCHLKLGLKTIRAYVIF